MAEIQKLSLIDSKPGIRRDGTNLDGDNYSDGQWVRFQRGRPKKMGGYSRITDRVIGPIRETLVWSRGDQINIFSFAPSTISVVQVDQNGGGSSVTDLTPSTGFTSDDEYLWSVDTMYDSAAGSEKTLVLAVPTKTASNIDDQTEHAVLYAPADGSAAFQAVTDTNGVTSGGVFVSAPYAVLYGSDGKITWSNANEPQNYTTGDAGTTRLTGSKVVHGKAIRSGSGAGGLLWALDSLNRMDYVGGVAIFRFSKVGACSILAESSVIEYDGIFYWIGVDRFYATEGQSIKEVPNVMNLNWFFDNVNYTHRQKIWAMKIPRYGEIWWFYPRGENTECSHAIIFNVREQSWYDCELPRSSGYYSQVFRYPVMSSSINNDKRNLTITVGAGSFSPGDQIIGVSSGAIGTLLLDTGTSYHMSLDGENEFTVGEGVSNLTVSGSATINGYDYFYSIYSHERGKNAIEDTELAIESYFTTADFGLPANAGLNRLTRLLRIEPDFVQTGDISVSVLSHKYANSDEVVNESVTFGSSTEFVEPVTQCRHIQLRFESNEVNGHYEMGKTIVWTEPGDLRP